MEFKLNISYIELVDFDSSTMNLGLLVTCDDGKQCLIYGAWTENKQGWCLTARSCSKGLFGFDVINALLGNAGAQQGSSKSFLSVKRLTEEILPQSEGQKIIANVVAKELQGE